MFDYRLEVFDAVARRLSFTRAAEELCITQPAVTRHIKELERKFRIKLFERKGNSIFLTHAGMLLLKHTAEMREVSARLEYELNMLHKTRKGSLRIGASTTIAQYVLPPLLAGFHGSFGDIRLSMLNANTECIERALLNSEIEIGLIEGESKRRDIQYLPFAMDEIVLVSGLKNPHRKKGTITLDDLKSIPIVLREPGSGTLEVLSHALKKAGMKLSDLNTEMTLVSSESIKSYLRHSGCMAFVSHHAVLDELLAGSLKIVDIEGLSIKRDLLFILPRGPVEALPELFMRFASFNYKGPGKVPDSPS
jgi:LysR family transcriptional regulator, transcriptional activator of the cysJI operon